MPDALQACLKSAGVDLWSDARQWPVSCRLALNVKRINDACVRSAMLDVPFEQPPLLPIMDTEIAAEAQSLRDMIGPMTTAILTRWFERLGIGFNPETAGSEYVNVQTGANALSGIEQEAYEADMRLLRDNCADPEEAALIVAARMGLMPGVEKAPAPAEAGRFSCANCDWTGAESELRDIKDYSVRVDPEDECEPDGECPACGCLAYAVKVAA